MNKETERGTNTSEKETRSNARQKKRDQQKRKGATDDARGAHGTMNNDIAREWVEQVDRGQRSREKVENEMNVGWCGPSMLHLQGFHRQFLLRGQGVFASNFAFPLVLLETSPQNNDLMTFLCQSMELFCKLMALICELIK